MRPKYSEKRENVILVQDRISRSSKRELRPSLRCRRITPYSVGVRPIPENATIINFGGGRLPVHAPASARVLNKPDAVATCANKLATFRKLQEANVASVRWTDDRNKAEEWLRKGKSVLARLQLASSGGRGIRVVRPGEELAQAPLYTRYFPKTHEFRVHVVDGQAIDIVEKKLRDNLRGNREERSLIRNHRNGWVFAHGDLICSHPNDITTLKNLGVGAVAALGLDFGAVDILAVVEAPKQDGVGTEPRRLVRCVVCEVNSAPGIENTRTRQAYVDAFNKIIGDGS